MAGASWDWLVLFLWILVLSCAVRQTASYHETLLESGTEPPATDMISVNWTLYSGLFLTWNEASHYCHQQGGHLPVLDTPLTTQAFSMAADRWHHGDLIDTDVWLGLHSSLSGTVPEIWEGICLLQQSDVIYWDSDYDVTEPDGLDTERCVRMKTDAATWGTTDCGNAMGVVCEWRGGICQETMSDLHTADADCFHDDVDTTVRSHWLTDESSTPNPACACVVNGSSYTPNCVQASTPSADQTTATTDPATSTADHTTSTADQTTPTTDHTTAMDPSTPSGTEITDNVSNAAVSRHKLCPCKRAMCRRSPSGYPALALNVIERKSTSQYRHRLATANPEASVSEIAVGVITITISVTFFAIFVFCDIPKLDVCCGGRNRVHGKRTTSACRSQKPAELRR